MSEMVCEPKQCVGCGACVQSCPQGCISMFTDREGFLRPGIEEERCLNCNLCRSVCPVLQNDVREAGDILAYAARAKDPMIRNSGSSGGLFWILARSVVRRGGAVFGAAFSKNFRRVQHVGVTREADLVHLIGSKYVQSDTGNTFTQVQKFLERGVPVYYSGTPCQIAGLKCFLGGDAPGLITQDVICHGVPSPAVWSQYIAECENRTGSAVKNFIFRDKVHGWKNYSIRISFSNGEERRMQQRQCSYFRGYLENLFLRPCCYQCRFKSDDTVQSDLTLSDFWGVGSVLPDWDDNLGVSLVQIRTERGGSLLRQVESELIFTPVNREKALMKNPNQNSSAMEPPQREEFFRRFAKDPHIKWIDRLCPLTWKDRVRILVRPR